MNCPTCSMELKYKRWYLGRDGWWCVLCHGWCRPVAVPT